MPERAERKFDGRERQRDVRSQNIIAARAVADCVRTSLGPKGMDKMIISSSNNVVITNDGATILKKLNVQHPAAKMLVDLSRAQDVEAGDGTTSVVVICGALLEAAQKLLDQGVHPSVISDAFLLASQQVERLLQQIGIPCNLGDRDSMILAAVTSLNSKVVSSNSEVLAPLAVDAVMSVIDTKTATHVDLDLIKVVCALGGTTEDTKLIDGLVLKTNVHGAAGGPSFIKGAKVGLIQYCLSPPKTNMENSVIVGDYQQIDRVLKEEKNYILKLLKPIIKAKCNVLLIQKSILRDAVHELALHYLAKKNIMLITDVERNDIEFISTSLGCTPIADPGEFTADKLGHAEMAQEMNTPGGKLVQITGVKNPGKTVSILVRGSNELVMGEADRSIHDALCVVRCLVKQHFLVPGGAAPETHLSLALETFGEELGGLKGYCISQLGRALDVVAYTLAENAGLHPINVISALRKAHVDGNSRFGINIKSRANNSVSDMVALNVVQPLLVSSGAMKLAIETVRMILKIDDIVAIR
jgi:T-complex protein 1 subunit delta